VEFKFVFVGIAEGGVVVFEAQDIAIVIDTDKQGPAIGIGEGGNRLNDDFLQFLVHAAVAYVPAEGGLEFKLVAFPFLDQVLD